ncbi:MAG: hypothetical protein ACK4UJ_10925 [Leptonema sp. (in: bacteria)]
MKIYINDQNVDYKIEDEKNLEEVYSYIEKEVRKFEKYIIDYKYTLRENRGFKFLRDIPVDIVNEFYLYTGDIKELIYFNLRSLYEYIDEIGSYFFLNESINVNSLKGLKEGFNHIYELVNMIKKYLGESYESISIKLPEDVEKNFKNSFENLIGLIHQLDENNYKILKEGILLELRVLRIFAERNMYAMLSEVLEDVDVINALEEFYNKIDTFSENLSNININFQTGKESHAIELFLKILEDIDIYITILVSAIEKKKEALPLELYNKVKDVFKEITNKMEQLAKALDKNDIIELGDILEYEFTESLNELKNYLPEIKKELMDLSLQKK